MAIFRMHKITTAALVAAAGLGLAGASWAQGTPPAVAPPATSITSPDTPPSTSSGKAGTNSGNEGGTKADGTRGSAGTPPAAGQARTAPSAADGKPAHADAAFMDQAAQNGHAEVEAAKLALQKAQSDAVKSFARKMVDEHTAAAQELQTLAAAKNHKLPDGPSLLQKGKLKLMATRDGAKFDREYIDEMGPKAHRETIELFEKGASKAHDPDVKAYADKTLPTLREHLKMAEALDQNLNGKHGKNATHDAPLHDKNAKK